MANRVEIEVIARDFASGVLDEIKTQLADMGVSAAMIAGAFTAAGATLKFISDGTREILKYMEAVQEVKNITGQAADESARLLLLFEKFGISSSEATMAARKFAQDGVEFSIESLLRLSDQFKAIEKPEEQQKFLLDNMGRAGFEYADMLRMSREELEKLYANVPKELVPTDEQLEQAHQYNIEVATLDQNWLAVKMSLLGEVVPALNILTAQVNTNFESLKNLVDVLWSILNPAHMLFDLAGEIGTMQINGGSNTPAPLFNPDNVPDYLTAPGNYTGSLGDWQQALTAYDTMLASGGAITTSSFGAGFRDAGGRGEAGRAYMIGRGAQPEMYVPDSAGTFYPNAGGGSFTFVYSPTFSMGDRHEAEVVMAPVIEQVMRRMQRDGRA